MNMAISAIIERGKCVQGMKGEIMDYEVAASFWTEKDKTAKKMEPRELHIEIVEFLKAHHTCALATHSEDGVRCTPLSYTVHGGYIDIFSEGGEKFSHLAKNKNVSLTVFDPYEGPGTAKSVQIQGVATVLGPDDENYAKVLTEIGMGKLLERNDTLYLIRVKSNEIVYLNGSLRERGYYIRQVLER